MKFTAKPLSEQVIVITGASSGIGLVTARMAAKAGATLVLAARSDDALRDLTSEIISQGGQAVAVTADVSSEADIKRLAQTAVDSFGGFDTWVNNAGVSIYGKTEDVPVEDMRQLFETNVWGLVYGSLEAVKHFKVRGGTLINIGSVLSDRAVPLQGIYCASKHAVKGFTDALRMELEADGAPINVTLVKPGPIDTPYPHHAKNYLEAEPTHLPPVYAPETVAQAILHAAVMPTRDVFVGGSAAGLANFGNNAPRLADKVFEATFIPGSKSKHPPRPLNDNGLDHAHGDLEERGGYEGHTRETSLYTTASLHPVLTSALVVGAGVAIAALVTKRNGKS